jgi:pyruvate,orthophosphate dikinase
MDRFVYDFAEGGRDLHGLIGVKSANLAELTNLGLPVPPGFTILASAFRRYPTTGGAPADLSAEVTAHLRRLEARLGRRFGDHGNPLLVSVRAGARSSMPGLMETVLNIGLTDETVTGLAEQSGDELFAWDSYRRLIQRFGRTVCGVPNAAFEAALDEARLRTGVLVNDDFGVDDVKALVAAYKAIVREHTGADVPQQARDQLDLAVRAVFESWDTPRAVLHRRQERIPADEGVSVIVQAMVFGNGGPNSGTGVASTRDPQTGRRGVCGMYSPHAQGGDPASGVRDAVPLRELAHVDTRSFDELMAIAARLERHYRDLCDVEFTIERGRLWILKSRVSARTPSAAFLIASQLVDEGIIDEDEALMRVSGAQLARLMASSLDVSGEVRLIAEGVPAASGAACGRAVFDADRAVELAADGEPVILVRPETTPDDLPGMTAARGVLTARGGRTSHAAVAARGLDRPCVCGAAALHLDVHKRQFRADGVVVSEGDLVSLDGGTGRVYLGTVPVQPSAVTAYLDGDLAAESDRLLASVHRLLTYADRRRQLGVRANADTPGDADRARRFGAHGIGLCRTERMFRGDRRSVLERLILTDSPSRRAAILEELLTLQRSDFLQMFRSMDGLPVTVRLIDARVHEFLPSVEELTAEVAVADALGQDADHDARLLATVRRMQEQNPVLGLRGVRLGLLVPGLFATQARAVAEAAVLHREAGGDPRPEIMVPLVGAIQELETVREEIGAAIGPVLAGSSIGIKIGTMVEVPRAALTAGQIADAADFFSLGTNDLTQLVWGFSRDDVEAVFVGRYAELGILGASPFETIDIDGVGHLIRVAVARGRAARPDLQIGVCGEHAGDPESIRFFAHVGLDYVSCAPLRVPIARLEAGRAAVAGSRPAAPTALLQTGHRTLVTAVLGGGR